MRIMKRAAAAYLAANISLVGGAGEEARPARPSSPSAQENVVAAALGLYGDFTGDGDVDVQDYAALHTCAGLGPEVVAVGCASRDADFDLDVDLWDFSSFQNAFTGPLTAGVCGNGVRNLGEQCDDANTVSGDGCSGSCRIELPNDSCASPMLLSEGSVAYSNAGATTDGPAEPAQCGFFGDSQVGSDLWYCYRASATCLLAISLCGSEYDTKLAVYEGCHCPTSDPASCSDDDCGTAVANVQSRVTVSAVAGKTYLIRAGGFAGAQGSGRLTIQCQTDVCGGTASDCFAASPTGQPGCNDEACCEDTCTLDRFCCDVTWDEACATEAEGVCTGSFAACSSTAGACGSPRAAPGCNDVNCCNTVCLRDPWCCVNEWDAVCVSEAAEWCP